MLNLHRVLFCTGLFIAFCLQFVIVVFPDHTHLLFLILMLLCKLTVWLICILFFIAFHWLVTTFGIVKYVMIGVPLTQPNLHLSEI